MREYYFAIFQNKYIVCTEKFSMSSQLLPSQYRQTTFVSLLITVTHKV